MDTLCWKLYGDQEEVNDLEEEQHISEDSSINNKRRILQGYKRFKG